MKLSHLMPGAYRKRCPWHKLTKQGYLQRIADGDKRLKAGEKQRQCPDCLRWFWRHEYGKKPLNGSIAKI